MTMADEQKTISEDEKALIRLIKIACIGFILFSILGSLGAFTTHYYKMQKVNAIIEQHSNTMNQVLMQEKVIQRQHNSKHQTMLIHDVLPTRKNNEVTIQSKTYKNGSLIKETTRNKNCVFRDGKKICLD